MFSEIEAKTNEFMRRRKLRLQQVREQSKDIAKKVRQRADLEKHRHIINLDVNKERQYLDQQEKIVRQLEELYAKGQKQFGSGHMTATEIKGQESIAATVDVSQARGRAAAAKLRQKKQQQLNEKKKMLDRKLLARVSANEISREKNEMFSNKLMQSGAAKVITTDATEDPPNKQDFNKNINDKNGVGTSACNDMATQWDENELPQDSLTELSITKLSKKPDKDAPESIKLNDVEAKRIDLFALSEEMRDNIRYDSRNNVMSKSSLNTVSEYLQTRCMRLREPSNISPNKNLQSIRQTLMKVREGNPGLSTNACQVHDDQMVPVPSWHAEMKSDLYSTSSAPKFNNIKLKSTNSMKTDSNRCRHMSRNRQTINSKDTKQLNISKLTSKSTDKGVSETTSSSGTGIRKKTIESYNHSSRDRRDVYFNDENSVVKHSPKGDNAFTEALKESKTEIEPTKDQEFKNNKDIRTKIAVSKQKAEKDCDDAINLLKSINKESTSLSSKHFYMDDEKLQKRKEIQKKKLQEEIDKVIYCKHHSNKILNDLQEFNRYMGRHSGVYCTSPTQKNSEPEESNLRNHYSWVQVEESDSSLHHKEHKCHKKGKDKNSVKFNEDDCFDFKSRYKHTPPTRDTSRCKAKKHVEPVIIEKSKGELSSDNSQYSTDSDSSVNYIPKQNKSSKQREETSNNDRIIIYKILDSKKAKSINKKKLNRDVVQSLSLIDKQIQETLANSDKENEAANIVPSEEQYTAAETQNSNKNDYKHDAVPEMGEKPKARTPCFCQQKDKITITEDTNNNEKSINNIHDRPEHSKIKNDCICDNIKKIIDESKVEKSLYPNNNINTEKGATKDKLFQPANEIIKLLDPEGNETGKFYIGASGILKDDAYEFIIKLRKKNLNERNKSEEQNSELKKSNANTNYIDTNKVDQKQLNDGSSEEVSEIPSENPNNLFSESSIHLSISTSQDGKSSESLKREIRKTHRKQTETTLISNKQTPSSTKTSTKSNYSIPSNQELIQFSSSTSTAYMSPPDIILPRYLKEKSPPKNCVKLSNNDIHSENDGQNHKKKHKCHKRKSNMDHNKNRKTKPSYLDRNKCRKFSFQHTKHSLLKGGDANKPNHNCNSKRLPKSQHLKQNTTNLNPIIVKFINKLLELDEAKEIAMQECSSVETPGSSVIIVPSNTDNRNQISIDNNASVQWCTDRKSVLELIRKQIIKEAFECMKSNNRNLPKSQRKKYNNRHKIKNINISKNLVSSEHRKDMKTTCFNHLESEQVKVSAQSLQKLRSKSTATPRNKLIYPLQKMKTTSNLIESKKCKSKPSNSIIQTIVDNSNKNNQDIRKEIVQQTCGDSVSSVNTNLDSFKTPFSSQSEMNKMINKDLKRMQLAEQKIQNMAEIAERCTERLSRLDNVLQKVRQSKSTVYNQIPKTCNEVEPNNFKLGSQELEGCIDKNKPISGIPDLRDPVGSTADDIKSCHVNKSNNNIILSLNTQASLQLDSVIKESANLNTKKTSLPVNTVINEPTNTNTQRKTDVPRTSSTHELLLPHVLTTALEVQSPISNKQKVLSNVSQHSNPVNKTPRVDEKIADLNMKSHQILSSNVNEQKGARISLNILEGTEMKMMDLQQFNEILMVPYVTFEEFVKQYGNITGEGSNIEDLLKDSSSVNELSTQGDNLPNFIAELFKNKLLREERKFDIDNSTTSELTNLPKVKKGKKKSKTISKKKDFVEPVHSSDNNYTEHAISGLNMKWATSTLKKTLQHQALLSSSASQSSDQNNTKTRKYLKGGPSTSAFISSEESKDINDNISEIECNDNISEKSKNDCQNTLCQTLYARHNQNYGDMSYAKNPEDCTELNFTSMYSTKNLDNFNIRQSAGSRSIDILKPEPRQRTSTPVQLFNQSSSSTNADELFNLEDSSVKVTSGSLSIPDCSLVRNSKKDKRNK